MTAAAQVVQAPASASFEQPCVTERRTLLTQVERLHAIRSVTAEMDMHYDRYAETGCFAALGEAHRLEAQLVKLLDGKGAGV